MGAVVVLPAALAFLGSLMASARQGAAPASADSQLDTLPAGLYAPMRTVTLPDVPPSSKAYSEFRLRNQGTLPVQVTGVSTDCGCTVARLSDREIKPGGELLIPVEYRARETSGPFDRRITVNVLANNIEYRVQFGLRGSIKQPGFICFPAAVFVDDTGETPAFLYVRAPQETLNELPDRIVIRGDEPVQVVVSDNGSDRLIAKRILVSSAAGRLTTSKLRNAAIEFVLTPGGGRRVVPVMAHSAE